MPPPNDPSIADATSLYRGVAAIHVVRDDNRDRFRPTSAAFTRYDMSVILEDTLVRDGRTPEDAHARLPQAFLAYLTSRFAREHEQGVVRSPQPAEPAHGDVMGKKRRPVQRAFAYAAEWEIPPPADFEPPGT
jgi:hypothetical protein